MAQITIDDDCKNDVIRVAAELGLNYGQAMERHWYGYSEKEEIAEEAKQVLVKQIESFKSDKKIIEKAIARLSKEAFGQKLIINCNDILKEARKGV